MSYPKTMVKGDHRRQVESALTEMNLRHDGWRDAAEPAVERGGFLPPVTEFPSEQADAAAADSSQGGTEQGGTEQGAAAEPEPVAESAAPSRRRGRQGTAAVEPAPQTSPQASPQTNPQTAAEPTVE